MEVRKLQSNLYRKKFPQIFLLEFEEFSKFFSRYSLLQCLAKDVKNRPFVTFRVRKWLLFCWADYRKVIFRRCLQSPIIRWISSSSWLVASPFGSLLRPCSPFKVRVQNVNQLEISQEEINPGTLEASNLRIQSVTSHASNLTPTNQTNKLAAIRKLN